VAAGACGVIIASLTVRSTSDAPAFFGQDPRTTIARDFSSTAQARDSSPLHVEGIKGHSGYLR